MSRQFGVLVVVRMNDLGLTRSQLATAVGRDLATISRWRHGRNIPTDPEMRERLAAALQVTLRDLTHPDEWIDHELLGRVASDAEREGLRRADRGREPGER